MLSDSSSVLVGGGVLFYLFLFFPFGYLFFFFRVVNEGLLSEGRREFIYLEEN